MRQIKRFTAFLLCLLMILPTQELTVLAETMSAEHVQIEEMLSTEPMEDGSGSIEETQESEKSEEESGNAGNTLSSETSGTSEDGADRIKETLPLEPIEDGADRIKETLPLEPVEDGADRIKETLTLEPVEDGADRIKETLPLEPVEDGADRIKETLPLEVIKTGIDHIKKTLQLEPLEEDAYAIYWNPGDQLPIELATASNASSTAISNTSLTATSKASSKVSSTASDATSSNAVSTMPPKGRDTANGLSPAKPVKTLAKALERAKKLMKKKGLEPSDITIYAMNPMEIADGELYALNAGNIRIASWPDRPYENDALFYVNGGQLTLMNVQLEAEEPDREPDETELVYVRGGVLQMGQNVNINGRVIMDYRSDEEDTSWKKSASTSLDATKAKGKAEGESGREDKENKEKKVEIAEKTGKPGNSGNSGKAGSNISKYDIDPGEENIKLQKEKKFASTWREPIIELMDGFDGGSGEYLLEVKAADGDAESRELVTTLYADDTTEEEFLSYFSLAESEDWSLQVEAASTVQLRDTGAKSTESEESNLFRSFDLEEEILTSKTLFASRSLTNGNPVYWNPGPGINVGGTSYPAGSDNNNDGTVPTAPLKTWEKAADEARKRGGIVVAMQSLDLGVEGADAYLPKNGNGEFYIASQDDTLITSLTTWNASAQPAIIVAENKTLIVENLFLDGRYDGGSGTEAPTILVDKGNLIVEKNVKTEEKGYIELKAFSDLKNHPIQIRSVETSEDGKLRLFFSGINESIEYRYTDVVVPGGALKESIDEIDDEADKAIMAYSIGEKLLERLELYRANRNVANGGLSKFDWSLRQDTNEDNDVINAQNIELYADYYFDAIYIDGVRGDDNNYGATCAYPVKTWGRAYTIWQREMERSRQARQTEVDAGDMFWEDIIEKYPMPKVIYICDTVTVSDSQSWELAPCYDPVSNTNIVTEVRSHIDEIAIKENGEPLHNPPTTMIEVTETGVLNINNVFIRNMTDDTDSVTIRAKGTLNFGGDTTLSGTRVDRVDNTIKKTLTLGNHVTVTGGGRFVMKTNWTGSIEYKEQGVVADGSGTKVEMNGGSIQKNNSYRTDYYTVGRIDHKAGGGVALSDGARFTMNDGEITQNQSYQYGAGIYLTGAGTSFIMKKGELSGNKLLETYVSMTNKSILYTQGVGIYAGTGTIVEIGDDTSKPENTLISENQAFLAYGTGIYADGSLSIKNATVSDNKSGGSSAISSNINFGIGIYIGANGILTMDGGLVKGNQSSISSRGDAKGAGIYIAAKTNSTSNEHTITKSTITGNITGMEFNSSTATTTSQGGGIYLAEGNTLTVTDTTISNNRSARGGGICAVGSSNKKVTLTLEKTVIQGNEGKARVSTFYGDSGGIYFYGEGNLTLKDGTKIIGNSATQHGGGIYIAGVAGGNFVSMMGSQPGAIEISGNKTESAGDGGGVYHNGISWGAKNVLIQENEASLGGGIYSANGSYGYFNNVVISENRASNGAGVMLNNSSRYFMQDSSIENNNAYNNGGGINLASSGVSMYLSETTDGAFKLSGNHAEYGGGIAISYAQTFVMDIAGPIQNSAVEEGSNVYLSGATDLSILNGAFKQPDEIAQVEGVHNIYIDDTTTASKKKCFDFSKVTVEKKEGKDPDVIFLNSGNSFLTVLAPPPNADYGAFPIDLNTKAFGTGSVVLKPGGISYYTVQVVYKPNAETSGIVTETKTYPELLDATENLNYYRGGKLPRRNDLGGFKDSQESNKINVVLFAQGVYLDGENGHDSNDGSSPERAVKTFEIAKERLEERIIETAAADHGQQEDGEKEGYAPFIYICGQVTINQLAVWELDYDDFLYKETNKYYAIAEVRNEAPVYEAQVRRFASFVDKPMILVSGYVPFTLKRLIIDGMADKVVLADQGANSPVIRANANSTVTLNGDSMITNNYNNVLLIYGKLLLKGEERDMNKQLYNNPAEKIVNLYASAEMKMEGYARIVTESAEENVFSGVAMRSVAVYTANTAVKVSMEDHSAIIQGSNPIVSSNYVIQSSYSDFTFEMKDAAKIEIDTAVDYPVYSSGANAIINMSGNASLVVLENGYWTRGIQLQNNSSLTMSEQANITYRGIVDNRTKYAVYLAPASSAKATVTMKDNAEINYSNNTSYAFGIYVSTGTGSEVNLSNNAKIIGSNGGGSGGIYVGSTALAVQILLNMEEDGSEEESASIMNMSYGIYMPATTSTARTTLISMGKKALITGCSNGMFLADIATLTTVNIAMKDYSKISKSDAAGICLYRDCRGLVNFQMEDYAAIEQSAVGISEPEVNGSAYYNAWHLDVTMSDYTRISGNFGAGIQLAGYGNWSEDTGYQQITLKDSAMIGGDNYYSGEAAASGNQKAGIYASGPIKVNMYGNSKISGNGMLNGNNEGDDSGIYLIRRTVSGSFDRYRPGTAEITLYDGSSICNNRGSGVYGSTIVDSTATYHNKAVIELNGIKDGENLTQPSIQGNTAPLYLGTDTTLKLKGGALVKNGDNGGWAIDNYGFVELDGRSSVEGLIYMEDSKRPITMTHAVAGDLTKSYDLHLTEGFAGEIVVKPDGEGILDLTATGAAGSQLAYFNKVSADGMAAERPIVELSPNLVLLGENNVYLSGAGNDNYAGNTPTTAVRTFKRARELLKGDSYYTAGANIIICGFQVEVQEDDIDWSFDAGGYVTNSLSGDRWKPLVIRGTGYSGNLIVLRSTSNSSSPITAEFKNITIDGGSENGITLGIIADNSLLKIETGKTAILGEGAVLQNNKAVVEGLQFFRDTAMGVVVQGGTLEINGGIIQNMVRETNYDTSTDLFATAIAVQGMSSFPAKLIMRSGQIINNELKSPNSRSTSSYVGTILLDSLYSSMEMSGGLIENNKVFTNETNPAAAGAIVNNNGSVTISGGIIRDNEGGRGSAIFHESTISVSKLIFSGGQIGGNRTNISGKQSVGSYAPVYIAGNGMELRGGSANISDGIFLNQTDGVITVSDHIYQTGRTYRIYFDPGTAPAAFKKGSVVVQPDGNRVTDVTSYLPHFDVRSNPYVLDQGRTGNSAGTVAGVKENQCLLLMQAIYLDSGAGSDVNDGSRPGKAVKTFPKAKGIGEASTYGASKHYVIYVCGNAASNTTNSETLWTLPETAYLCRYTGFPVYESDGTATQLERAYYGYLIEPKFNLTFQNIGIQGRRGTDSTESRGDSLVKVSAGIQVTVEDGAVFSNNNNNGNYIAEDERPDPLSSKGGAFQVEEGGSLTVKGGRMEGTDATYGDSIYLEADKTNPGSFGKLHLSGSGTVQPVISGNVYLDGTGNSTSAYITTEANYVPSAALQISIGNDFNGRPVVSYTDSTQPGEDELKYYKFDDAINALYDIVNRESEPQTLELNLRKVIYLDGQDGSDEENHDGTTPEKAFKTLKRTFEAIGEESDTKGVLVYVVGTVDINENTGEPYNVELMNVKIFDTSKTSHYEGSYKDGDSTVPIRGQVFFRRYSKPTDYDAENSVYEGYGKETLYDSLFYIKESGKLTLDGIYLDGHSISTDSINPTLKADAVKAMSSLVTVEGTGALECKRAEGVTNAVATETLFTNNANENAKNNTVGYLEGVAMNEGSSAGIELLDGGIAVLEGVRFSNLSLGTDVAAGGTDVYSNGTLSVSYGVNFGGSVFLEGLGTKDDTESHKTSRFLTVKNYGIPVEHKFQVLMRDPYLGRKVVYYPEGTFEEPGTVPTETDIGYFLLEERVKEFFYLTNRSENPYILELQTPIAVYIDGTYGNDDQTDRAAGSTPRNPVKTLKRAFELLKTRCGDTIYVVNTIQVNGDILVAGMPGEMSYRGEDGLVLLGSTNKVQIVRYVQPDFAQNMPQDGAEAGYDVPDFSGALLNVEPGVSAQFSTNVYFDGHSEPKDDPKLPKEVVVSWGSEAKAPLITVEKGGILNLLSDVTLYNNNNTYDPGQDSDEDSRYKHGGAIYNSGTTTVDGAWFKNNKAEKGSVVYQDGTFTILGAPEKLIDGQNEIYLTTENKGEETNPTWGADHELWIAVPIPDGKVFNIDMDRREKGRNVIRFTSNTAYDPNADAEHDHFRLADTVPRELFLVEAVDEPDVLELQDWEILKVEVPTDIYLVVSRNGSFESTTRLKGVMSESPAGAGLFTAPEYTVENKGIYDAKVSITGFENKTAAEISSSQDLMTLVGTSAAATGVNDLYLAVKGLDDTSGGTGFDTAETSLQPYAESSVTELPLVLGTLKSHNSGRFTFIGSVGNGFVDKYMDSTFPVEGASGAEVQKYMDGRSDTIHARAKYLMKYKVEIVPPRRTIP